VIQWNIYIIFVFNRAAAEQRVTNTRSFSHSTPCDEWSLANAYRGSREKPCAIVYSFKFEWSVERRKKNINDTMFEAKKTCALRAVYLKEFASHFLYLDLYYVYLEKYFLSNFCIHSRLITKLIELFAQRHKIKTISTRFRLMNFCDCQIWWNFDVNWIYLSRGSTHVVIFLLWSTKYVFPS
jgi:hypothetical protein